MKKNNPSVKRSFLVNPYLVSLILFAVCFLTIIYWYVMKPYIETFVDIGEWEIISRTEDFKVFAIAISIYIAFIVSLYSVSDQGFSVVTMKEDCVVVHCPFRRRKKLRYEDIQSIGIDIGTTGAFWIYISRKPFPQKYRNRINRMPRRKCDVLFSYSDKAYGIMCEYLPGKINKQFAASASVLRLYNKPQQNNVKRKRK